MPSASSSSIRRSVIAPAAQARRCSLDPLSDRETGAGLGVVVDGLQRDAQISVDGVPAAGRQVAAAPVAALGVDHPQVDEVGEEGGIALGHEPHEEAFLGVPVGRALVPVRVLPVVSVLGVHARLVTHCRLGSGVSGVLARGVVVAGRAGVGGQEPNAAAAGRGRGEHVQDVAVVRGQRVQDAHQEVVRVGHEHVVRLLAGGQEDRHDDGRQAALVRLLAQDPADRLDDFDHAELGVHERDRVGAQVDALGEHTHVGEHRPPGRRLPVGIHRVVGRRRSGITGSASVPVDPVRRAAPARWTAPIRP